MWAPLGGQVAALIDSHLRSGTMGNSMGQPRVSYQTTLRMVGAYLDDRKVEHFRLIEVPGGYQIQCTSGRTVASAEFVAHEQLLSLRAELRRRKLRRRLSAIASVSTGPTRYENVLRALGYELDAERASSILLDEIDEGILVTYQYRDPFRNFFYRKRHVVLGSAETRSLLDAAMERRHLSRDELLERLVG